MKEGQLVKLYREKIWIHWSNGAAYRDFYGHYKSRLTDHPLPPKLGRTQCWTSSLVFGLISTDHKCRIGQSIVLDQPSSFGLSSPNHTCGTSLSSS